MLKKIMATAFLVCAIPAMASAAWFLSTQVMSGGGTISSANGPAQDYKSGAVFKSYSAADQGTQTVTFTPNTGYSLELLTSPNLGTPAANLQSYILLQQKTFNDATGNYTTAALPLTAVGSAGAYSTTFNPVQNSTVTIAVNYKVARVTVTAAMALGTGNVSPSAVGNITYGYTLQAPLSFYFSPAKNTQITSIGGLPDAKETISYTDFNGVTQSFLSATGTNNLSPLPGVNQRVRIQFPKGYVFTGTYVAGAYVVALQGTSSSPTGTLNAGLAKTVTAGSAATTLTATGTLSGGNVTWSYVSGPLNTASGTFPSGKGTNGTNIPTLIPKPDLVSPSSFNAQSFSPGVLTATGQYVFKVSAPAANGVTSYNPTGLVTSTVTVNVVPSLSQAAQNQCQFCHTANGIGAQANAPVTLYTNWSSSVHRANNVQCSGCHYQAATGGHPGALTCANCHTTALADYDSTPGSVCSKCHPGTDHKGFGLDPVTKNLVPTNSDCVGCHDVAINHNTITTGTATGPGVPTTALVSDNNSGVRAITGTGGEFDASTRNNTAGYRSHHIYNGTGIDPQNAQCIVCHLEGKASGRTVVIDPAYHMHDANVYLRSGKHSITADVIWNPANPTGTNHTDMDNFCMSCHNAAGAVDAFANVSSALKGMTPIPGALPLSAKNPFGDLMKNAYDGLVRPQVVAVYEQFDTGNVSHHAVRGQKYTGAYRAGNPNNVTTTGHVASTYPATTFTQYSGATNAVIHTNAKSTHDLQTWQYFQNDVTYATYSTAGPAAGYGPNFSGSRKTLYEANLFAAQYTPLGGGTLGDDSTLHCGDCHSVGQWKRGSTNAIVWNNTSTASNGATSVLTTAVIGAHGSKNEYMLRTSNGTDALHTMSKSGTSAGKVLYTTGNYVCFLCHRQDAYADNGYFKTDAGVGVTAARNHGGLGVGADCINYTANFTQSVGKVGYAARVGFVGGGNKPLTSVFGYNCANCHSSGTQLYGGIHGNSSADGSNKNIAFLSYSTDGVDTASAGSHGAYPLPSNYTKRNYDTEHDTLNFVQRLPYRFMGGSSLRYNGGGTASKWEAKTLNGLHREGCYNLAATTDTTVLWNTTNPTQTLPYNGATVPAKGGNAINNNNGNDSAVGATDYSSRIAQNDNGTSGWGSCNHHQGSTSGSATAPTRSVQRPLAY